MNNKNIKLLALAAFIAGAQPAPVQAMALKDIPGITELMACVVTGGIFLGFKYLALESELQQACREGDLDLAEKLLMRGKCDVNPPFYYCQNSPINIACLNDNLELLHLLISYGAKINQQDHGNATLLHKQCVSGSYDTAKFLLLHGADPTLGDFILDKKPSAWAVDEGFIDLANLFDAFEEGMKNYLLDPVTFKGIDFAKLDLPGKYSILDTLHPRDFFLHYYYYCHKTDDFEKIAMHYASKGKIGEFNKLVKENQLDTDNYVKRNTKLIEIQNKLCIFSLTQQSKVTNLNFKFIN